MKRTSVLGFVGLLASILAGCPLYSGDGHTGGTQVCVGDDCSSGTSGCSSSADCQQNETCGSNSQCHPGDCTSWGCSPGNTCTVDPSSQLASCTAGTTGTGGHGGSGTGGSGTGASTTGTGGTTAPVYCGHPSDCPTGETCAPDGTCKAGDCKADGCIFGYTCAADGTCQAQSANSCDTDANCASLGAGFTCLAGPKGGGVCTQPADQCFDQSQCDSGDKCVAGKCTPSCTTNSNCRDGYACDTTLGTCSKPVKTCTVTNDCASSAKVCVGGTCVPRSVGGTCAAGDVWDENGCIPNQAATFTCVVDGTQDACATGSICLHHSCWISCDSPNQTVCANLASINTCKPVVSTSSTHDVCGSSQNLGSECGAGSQGNKTCSSGKICIDGFCK